MPVNSEELRSIIVQFAESGWDLIDEPARAWLGLSGMSLLSNEL